MQFAALRFAQASGNVVNNSLAALLLDFAAVVCARLGIA
jgi:hypothetical protein